MAKIPLFIFIHSLLFMLALILTAGLINTVLPSERIPPSLGDVSVKFQYFTEHKDDYDMIFLGPSTTYHGIIPKLFDESMAANGNFVRSFNLGLQAANIAEMDFYLQKILALKPANLKWIFLDCFVNSIVDPAPTSARSVYWHNPLKTIENFKLVAESPLSFKNKISAFYANTISFIYRWLGIGGFSNLLQLRTEALPGLISSTEKLIESNGYYAMDWMTNSQEWKKLFQSSLEDYRQRLKTAKSGAFRENTSTYPLNSYAIQIIKKVVYRIDNQKKNAKKIKMETIFLIPPALDPNNENEYSVIVEALDLKYISTVFAFYNPNTFPALYEVDSRSDDLHLNHKGAQEFTRTLASQFSQYLKLSQKEVYN
ncbi:hypothetical protein QUB70_12030 [Microcoleus sp. A003_D6]|uniref:hypothetical protein n=1 Tax=Microcoleus sp. A003_D6 TaxID=3055266 RepID=UPI002FD35FDF